MFKKNCSSLGQRYKNLLLVLTKKGGIKSSHSQFLTTNYYPHQNHWKLALKIIIFNQTWEHMRLQSPVFYVWFDSLRHHYGFIIGHQKSKKGSQWKRIFFQNKGWWNLFVPRISSGLFVEEKNCWYQKTFRTRHFIEERNYVNIWVVWYL